MCPIIGKSVCTLPAWFNITKILIDIYYVPKTQNATLNEQNQVFEIVFKSELLINDNFEIVMAGVECKNICIPTDNDSGHVRC